MGSTSCKPPNSTKKSRMEYIGPAAATAGATIKIIEFSYKLHNTSHETSDYLNLATLIQTDLNEAIRLRNAHAQALDTPSLSRIDTVIRSTKTALSSVAALVEDFRLEIKEKGKVGMGNKLSWAFKDSREMQTKYVYLSGCQQSLLSVLAELKAVAERERERGGGAPPAYDGHYDEEEGGRLMAALASKHSVRRPRGPGGAWEMQDSSSIPSSFSQQASSPQISVNLPYGTYPRPSFKLISIDQPT
ncbi:MAG: hypothetical protein M1813_008535 [Trichoglossum hirsutum]|nr:MAG: hypothetical protein M1813_008535 [Trichoglossum hirsutum]